jgi:ABC-2 type transport system permease protein
VSQTVESARPAPGRGTGLVRLSMPSPADFRDALHAEWTKLRTVGGTGWLLLAAAALTIAVGAAAAAVFSCSAARAGCAPAATGADPAKIGLTGVYLGQAVIAVFGVMVIGGEYGTGLIRVTLTATPRRLAVLAAKALIVAGCALTAAVVAVGGSVLAGRLILPTRGLTAANGYLTLSLGNGADLRAAGGSVLYLALIALFALGVTMAVRDSAVGVGLVLGLLYLFPLVAAVVPDQRLARHLDQVSPMIAGLYIQATVGVRALPLTPWQGLGVTALWAAGALILGGTVLLLRDA